MRPTIFPFFELTIRGKRAGKSVQKRHRRLCVDRFTYVDKNNRGRYQSGREMVGQMSLS